MNEEKWFKSKRYGYGWYPATWQAKVIVLLYIAVLLAVLLIFPENALILGASVFVLTPLLIYISYKKGEKAKWRWGDDN